MTLLFMDGFDHYPTSHLVEKGWITPSGTPIVDPTGGENGEGCVKLDYLDYLRYSIGNISGKRFTLGFATYWDAMPNSAQRTMFHARNDSGGSYVNMNVGSTGIVYLWNNGVPGQIYESSAGFFTTGKWYYIEMQIEFWNNSGGHISMHWDGVTIYDGTYDNVWTGSSNYNYFEFRGSANGVQRIDHVYILDEDGTKNNDYLGPSRVDTVLPNAAGNYAQMDAKGQTDNYDCVNEASLDESDFVHGVANGEKDSYSFPSLPSEVNPTISGIQVNMSAKKNTPDTIQARSLIRKGGSDYFGSSQALDNGVTKIKKQIQETDPSDASDWNKSKIEACEFGVDT
ncbi:unnamed protein product, partial [marine sediment metagenome]